MKINTEGTENTEFTEVKAHSRSTAVQAHLATALPGFSGAEVPKEIQWMPPGRHRLTPFVGGEPKTMEIEVDESLAKLVAEGLQDFRTRAAAGAEDLPYLDFNHDDREASGHPVAAYWAGSDPVTGGIRMKVEWTEAGAAALKGKTYRRFSPSFHIAKETGEILGVGLNMGGLVNRAAFKTIQPIWSRDGGDHEQTKDEEKNNMTPNVETQLAELKTAVAGVVETLKGLGTTVAEIQAKQGGAPDASKILVLETQVAGLTEAQKVQAKAAAQDRVRKAVELGKIPAANTELQTKWVDLIVAEAKNGELLDALPANPALQTVVNGRGAGASGAGATGEHTFLVKAKEYGTANKIENAIEAQTKFAGTNEGRELYKSYRESLSKS